MYGCLKVQRVFFFYKTKKDGHFVFFSIYKLVYGHLKPQKLHGVRMLVYRCVWMFESSKGFFDFISNQNSGHFVFYSKYRLVYGHLKPQKLHGVRMLVYGCVWMFESSKGFFLYK